MTDVRVVQTDSDTSLSHILEQTPVSPSTVLQVQEGSDTVTIPASFARAASPPPSTRRRMQRDESSTRRTPTSSAADVVEIRSPPMSPSMSRRSSARRSSSPAAARRRSSSFTSETNRRGRSRVNVHGTVTPTSRPGLSSSRSLDQDQRRDGTHRGHHGLSINNDDDDDDDDNDDTTLVGDDGTVTPTSPGSPSGNWQDDSDSATQQHQQRQRTQHTRSGTVALPTAVSGLPQAAPDKADGAGVGSDGTGDGAEQTKKVEEEERRKREREVSIVVGGRRFVVDPLIFNRHPDTMLSRMFSSSLERSRVNERGDYVIDCPVSADAFSAIIKYYRTGKVECPATTPVSELHEACNFFLIPFNHTSIDCDNVGKLLHELSNKGAIRQFEAFLKHSLLPAMAKCAEIGDRKCHIVVLRSEQTVEWDEDLPPSLGEQLAKVVYDTALNRFLFSYENRNIARQLLKDKGLKKIKLGIEGFPTFVERTRIGSNDEKLEVEYFYDQSPFIKASWEKEEHKSRHVDFQYVRTNTSANVLSTIMTS
ncbi:BTB domain containing 10 [Salpingoeca rosetta]|uniref:BTB domain containing 10 n=1 Tax=Salpingoeca rosetta (strain ATCC 50818 / BSB-021) TaxID=946362 RepID=F2U9A9_SALR5|nr:BTB domain containing 10 [Salpingoeca rosetta]EGD73312.1 BTB domain containing 10 [Salpingoeca rosetta]|eukprot:XP_004994343.1 BTB domain containing 10 [Salpingoeca rosetta]